MIEPPLQAVPGRRPINSLTGLRFFAAVAVVIFPFGAPLVRHFPYFLRNIANGGSNGVALFFMLSGFVLAYNYSDSSKVGDLSKNEFWTARFARIYPVYLLSLLLTLNRFVWLLRPLSWVNVFRAGISFAMVASLTQAWSFQHALLWNYPAWTLSVELLFYLAFPWAYAAIEKLRPNRLFPVAVVLILCGTGARVIYLHLHPGAFGFWVSTYWPPLRLPEFLVGLVLGRMYLVRPESRIRHRSVVSILAVIGIFITLALRQLGSAAVTPLALFFALLIYALASGSGVVSDFLEFPSFVLLGQASYSIYILQVPVMTAVNRILGSSALAFCVGLLALIAISIVTFVYFETPARRWIRAKWVDMHPQIIPAPAGGVSIT